MVPDARLDLDISGLPAFSLAILTMDARSFNAALHAPSRRLKLSVSTPEIPTSAGDADAA